MSKKIIDRIIPTYVGNTRGRQYLDCLLKDHPYIRGEHLVNSMIGNCLRGSSLHTWGTLTREHHEKGVC